MNPAKPTALKLLQGNPGQRPINKNEPKPEPVAPDCPEELSDVARKEWERVCPELEKLGLLTRIDRAALTIYCQAWADFTEAQAFLQKNGPVYIIKTEAEEVKYIQQVPQVAIANKNALLIKAFCQEFGMTPSARSRISIPGVKDEDEWDWLDR